MASQGGKQDWNSFKVFSRFWLVKTTRIIHHNQLLLSNFEKEALPYCSNDVKGAVRCILVNDDVKMTSKAQPTADCWTVYRENLLRDGVIFWWAGKQSAKWRNSFKNGEIVWMKNKEIIEIGFRRIWRILQISEDVIHLGLPSLWITPSLIRRILHILLSLNND